MLIERSSVWPTADEAVAVWERVTAGEPDAPSDLCCLYLAPLIAWLCANNRQIDEHLCEEAAGEALLSLLRGPDRYRPREASLTAYLRMSALGDLRNLLRRERRHQLRRANLEVVELSPPTGNTVQAGLGDPADEFAYAERRAELRRLLPATITQGLTPAECGALELMRVGERKTEPYAAVLGIAHLSMSEQRREVKRVKDRLKKRIERAGGVHVPPD